MGRLPAQLRYDDRSVTLRARHGRESSADFPELGEIAAVLGDWRVTLDGALVCLRDHGRPDFARLRRRLTGSRTPRPPAMLQTFDVLHLDGFSTRALPYSERRSLLEQLALEGLAWRPPASVVWIAPRNSSRVSVSSASRSRRLPASATPTPSRQALAE